MLYVAYDVIEQKNINDPVTEIFRFQKRLLDSVSTTDLHWFGIKTLDSF